MLILLLLGGLVVYLFYSMYSEAKKLPPGPFPFPFIGNLPQLAYGMLMYGGVANLFLRWKKVYGDVHTYWMGPLPMVNICDYQLAQEAMVKKGTNFTDRKRLYFFEIERDGKGIGSSNGDTWLEQRRFTLQTLRNFGMGKNLMEERVMLELDYRMDILDNEIEKAGGDLSIHPFSMLELTVGNIINRLLFTERFIEEEEKEFFRLKGIVDELMEKTNLFDFLLTRENSSWPVMRGREERVRKPLRELKKFIRTQVETRKRNIAAGDHQLRDNGEDFVDAYLIEMQKKDKSDDYNEENLVVNLMDLWGAGQETTSNTLTWALCYLVQNLDVLHRLQKELDDVTGKSRSLKLSDKPNTPYLNAVILELLRTSSVVPLNMLREAKEDTVVGNYVIPKGTAISAQISSIMLNENTFEHPEKFIPSRFLENNNLDQYVVAFSMGKRACPGESLARVELYLILGNIVLRYNLAPNPKHPAGNSALNEMGTIRKPRPFEVFFSKRY